ncbi:MAG TPA: energy-coupling factor ABC transporter permease [Dongiaceae bacterium]|nr:energy-coupling factor ABC transporter permease [Dongiaceae bacterium]
MHMSDALLSPAVGSAMWAASAVVGARCSQVVRRDPDDRRVPLMGVLGAFVFAAQMVNFSIPGTGSSGHLGGGMLLAILLGPHAAFLVMASVLAIQAFFFADGGLLALGCNVFNLAFFTSFVAYPLVFRPIAGPNPSRRRLAMGAVAASVVGLALGASGVVLETTLSGITSLPPRPFALLVVPVHLAIGLVEGLVTASVALTLWRARPELMPGSEAAGGLRPRRWLLAGVAVAALATGALLSPFASELPDGLEWAVARATGGSSISAPTGRVHALLARVQRGTAVLPDYDFAAAAGSRAEGRSSAGSSLSGVLGTVLTLVAALCVGPAIRHWRAR